MNLTSNTNLKQIGKQRRAGLWLTATLGSSFFNQSAAQPPSASPMPSPQQQTSQ